MRRNLLTISDSQIFHNLAETCVVHIHLCHIDHTRQVVLVTKLPRFFCTNLYTGFSGNHDNCRICCTHCFFYFADKIKISRCIQNIDLCLFPLDRDQARADRESALLLFFIKITGRIGLGNLSHTTDCP